MSVGANVTTTSLIDAIGDRLGQGTGSAFGGWLIADLHGNIVAAVSPGSSPALLSAYRYDAYGETCGSWSASSGSIAVPWRFQGRLLESATGSTDLYDFGARSYDPSLGAFTSFDSVAGSAQNPLTLNRYLYANANPATLVDPDGHVAWQSTCRYDPEDCVDIAKAKAHAKAKASALSGTTDMTTAVNNFRSWSANTDMTSAVDKFRSDTGAGACAWDQTADECKNIAAENKKQHYWELCNGGDKSACDTMNTIQVDTGNTSASLHIMLGAATFVPIIGSAAAAADTGLYLYEGNYTDAALSSLAVIPGGKLASGVKALHAGDDAAKAAGAGTKLHILDDIVGAFCSFSADTPVATEAGRTAIASIRVGDTVEAYDPKTGETGPHEVTAVSAKTDPVVEHLATDTGPIETTPNHPFFTADRGWVEAGQLVVGEQIRTESGHTTAVTGFTLDATPTTMWDLTVDGAHSFFVGSGAVLVHNACPSQILSGNIHAATNIAQQAGEAAHHIVAYGSKRADEARGVLDAFGIGINSAENGVFLPAAFHNGVHTRNYYEALNEALRGAGSSDDVLDILNDFRNNLLGGARW
jgi:RHS repeat-associated protein